MISRIKKISTDIASSFDCKAEVNIFDKYPSTVNHSEQAQHVMRLAKKFLGEENFSQDDLPMSAAEDFSFYLKEIPGCFYCLGTMKVGK